MAASARAQLPIDPAALVGRHDSMVVFVGGKALGWQTTQLVRTDGSLRLVDEFTLGEFVHQRTEIELGRDGRVRWVQQGGVVNGAMNRLSLEYRRDRVRGVVVVATRDGPVTLEADTTLPAGTIDDNAIALFLPALPWAAGSRWSFRVYIGSENAVRLMTLTVLGPASVTLPSGPVDTWEAELDGGNAPIRYYVTRSKPHRIARFELIGTGIEWILVN